MKKTNIIWAVVIIVLIIIGWFIFGKSNKQEVSTLDAPDTVINFYESWLKAVKEPETAVPSKATLASSPILSKELRTRLEEAVKSEDNAVDPVLCQAKVPENIAVRNVYVRDDEAQLLVTSRDKSVTDQATVTLTALDGGWYINSIECSLGEFAPDREFTFESEGYLLKSSIPAPYDSKNWHLIFEANGKLGNVVPLIYNSKSQCTGTDGKKSVCAPDKFTETTKVMVRGQMTERGAVVDQQEFIK